MMQSRTTNILVSLLSLLLCVSCDNKGDELARAYADKKGSYQIVTEHLNDDEEPQFTNRLIKQDSLYLLQHAHNPVQWWSWGDDAFAAAREQNKPVLLSIGYSTCHWCHVMARESFEDIEIATFINEHFIPIKVDREEHPDIDELYLTSVQMLSGQAGWPLTAILTPKGQAFFGGTYFAPDAFLSLLTKVNDTWVTRNEAVIEQAERLEASLRAINKSASDAKAIDTVVINEAAARIQLSFQTKIESSRSQNQPGFPREPEMLFLLNHSLKSLSPSTIKTITQRLYTLAQGGIHDQVGGGFHRYTVDANLTIPHFEKMLYNQAQMGQAYFRAYQLNADPILRAVGEATFEFLLRDMQAPEGGFYAAMDAESENEQGQKSEGAYYIWSHQQLATHLDKSELAIAESVLGVTRSGNFNGSNVLQNQYPAQANSTRREKAAVLDKLAKVRLQRKKPQTDTKIITAWNSMAISALLTGYQATTNEAYKIAAEKAAERLWKRAYARNGGLARTIPNGKQRVAGSLEDYAYFANALLDLYDVNGDKNWLSRSEKVAEQMIDRFHDETSGGFLISSTKERKGLVVTLVTARDDATYSGNSMAAQMLARLFQRTGKPDYRQHVRDVLSLFSKQLLAKPESLSGMLVAASFLNEGEIGSVQYGAKGKVKIRTRAVGRNVMLDIDIAKGWHINASNVLQDHLIPTALTATPDNCTSLDQITYPQGERVTLGFQKDELLVYEGSVNLNAEIAGKTDATCNVLAAELNIQACTDEVCQSPEKIQIRALLDRSL